MEKNGSTYGGGRGEETLLVAGGILGMVVAMGIGRFAFTPVLPLMQRDLQMSNTLAGNLAGINYAGYLLGALGCMLLPKLVRSQGALVAALGLSVLTTAAMGLTTSPFLWGGLRLVSGGASALAFIAIATRVGEGLVTRHAAEKGGWIYAGIGGGIMLSGLLVPVLDHLGSWSGTWLGLGAIALVLALGSLRGVTGVIDGDLLQAGGVPSGSFFSGIGFLFAAYLLEGLGYVVSATFLGSQLAGIPLLAPFASQSWTLVGMAAIPSTILWPRLARRFGNRAGLTAAYWLQAVGILLGTATESIAAVLAGALLFGWTFLGIVALTLQEGGRRVPGGRSAAVLTVAFGLGQIVGPVGAGLLADYLGGFTLPLLLAALCIGGSILFTSCDRGFDNHQPDKGRRTVCRT